MQKLTFISVSLFLAIAAIQLPVKAQQPLTYKSMKEFPGFNLQTLEGKAINTAALAKKGKPTLLMYFSPTCDHCIHQTEEITSHMKQWKGINIVMVSAYAVQDIATFSIIYGINKMKNITLLHDAQSNLGRFLALKSLPGLFLYNADRQLIAHFENNQASQQLTQLLLAK